MTHGGGPDLLGWLLAAVVLTVPGTAYVRAARRRGRPWPAARTSLFLTGLALVAVALAPPLTAAAHADPRVHMAQHLLLGMYAPLGLVLGAPVTVLLGRLGRRGRQVVATVLRHPVVHVLSHPLVAALVSTGSLFVLYLGPAHPLLSHPWGHHLVAVHFVLAGCLFTWAVAGPDPAPRRPSYAVRLGVLVLAAGAHAFLAKLLYAGAATLPALSGFPVDRSEQAAQLMYYGGDVAEVLLAVALCGAWARSRARRSPVRSHLGTVRRVMPSSGGAT